MQHQCRQGEQRTSRTMFPGGSSMRPCTSLARRGSFTIMIQVPAKWAYFLPPTKLQEGNVFTHVCYSVHREIWCHFLSGPMFLPRRGYDVTSCLVPCSFQGMVPGGGGYSLWGGDYGHGGTVYLPLVLTTSGSHYASYWNVFLFSFSSEIIIIGLASTLLNNLDRNNLAEIPLTVSRLDPHVYVS